MSIKLKKVDLSTVSSIKIGGSGKYIEVKNRKELPEISYFAKKNHLKIHILGEGTNSYFGDDLHTYIFLKLKQKGIKVIKDHKKDVILEIGASENWHKLVVSTVKNGYWGIENLALIPGSVGAAPVQNIGAYGVELKDVLESVEVYDIFESKFKTLSKDSCKFGYRNSIFKKHRNKYIILSLKIKLSKVSKPVLVYGPLDVLKNRKNITQKEIFNLVVKTRKEKLPNYKLLPNCGSFFKNPILSKSELTKLKVKYKNIPSFQSDEGVKVPAAWLIDSIGKMKGYQTENFLISPKQALVIINTNKGTYLKLNKLVRKIKQKVFDLTNIELEQEVNFVS